MRSFLKLLDRNKIIFILVILTAIGSGSLTVGIVAEEGLENGLEGGEDSSFMD